MSKTNNGDDFELLYEAYTGADEEEKDKKEELEDEENPVQEGMIDDTKSFMNRQVSKVGAAKDTIGQTVRNATGKGKREDIGKTYQKGKSKRIFDNHMKRINSVLSSFVTDLVKMGLADPKDAEKLAKEISNKAAGIMKSENIAGSVDATQNRNFDREQGDAADKFQR